MLALLIALIRATVDVTSIQLGPMEGGNGVARFGGGREGDKASADRATIPLLHDGSLHDLSSRGHVGSEHCLISVPSEVANEDLARVGRIGCPRRLGVYTAGSTASRGLVGLDRFVEHIAQARETGGGDDNSVSATALADGAELQIDAIGILVSGGRKRN